MSNRVLKWNVGISDLEAKIGTGKVVHVGFQGDPAVVQVWTLEDGDCDPTPVRLVRVFGTGHDVPVGWSPLGSVVLSLFGSPLVWHVFEAPSELWG